MIPWKYYSRLSRALMIHLLSIFGYARSIYSICFFTKTEECRENSLVLSKKIFRKGSNGVEEIFWLKHRVVYKVDKDNFTQSASIRRLMFHQTLDLVPSKRLRSSYRFQQIAKAKSSSSAISLLVSLMKINSKWSLSWVKIAVFLENVLGRLTLKWSEKNVSTIDQS